MSAHVLLAKAIYMAKPEGKEQRNIFFRESEGENGTEYFKQ